ncbi:hypothetical protein H6P81_016730 [Aristolochia fimbriata]|uniref:DUF7963 domain-containing protein n=1 Tax=Aristolochia fimbriata TaxID=158543 RepID=A0AAV7EB95_ARIFI|nr:hypothetical protein H6P81_016730 [Aristolochia fimbriata]
MATANSASLDTTVAVSASDDLTAKAVHKRYEGLITVRTKAIKGKGAWYWAHLEPILVLNNDTGLPKAVKLRCSLCEATFSASNPSRTASEHLKRGTCPNFTSAPKPLSSISPPPPPPPPSSAAAHLHSTPATPSRKRNASTSSSSYQIPPLAIVDPSRFCPDIVYPATAAPPTSAQQPSQPPPSSLQSHLVLSGGKEDLGALAMLEDSVKKLKSPKASPGPALTKTQIDSAMGLLSDWLYESCGAVSFSCVEHPKFRSFLQQVGLPSIGRRELAGPRLDAKYDEVKSDSEAKIRDALFFQVASDGWKSSRTSPTGENLVNLTVNLPNGTSLFRKAVFTSGRVPSKYAEEILWETVTGICGTVVERCVGIVGDKFKAKALRNLEGQNHWMVNLSCQLQGFLSLIKDFSRELPLFKSVVSNCLKLAKYFNTKSQVRNSFHKYQLQELDHAGLLRVPPEESSTESPKSPNFMVAYAMLEDILNSARALQLVVLDESYKLVCVEDPLAREVAEMIRDMTFWSELEAVHSLVKLVRTMAQDIEAERPLVGQCLPLWEELRTKVKEWCSKFNIPEAPVEKIVDKRFKKNYHPAWSAAFILDPLYLMRDTSGKYLPPFKCLTPEQEKDVDKLITRLVSREEAHIALMELMKWRSEGLDPLYAQAVQVKQRDPMTGKMKIANPQSSRLVWETCLSEFKALGKVAVRLIFLHATSCGFKCNWSFLRWVCAHGHSRVGMDRAQKLIFIAAHAKLERRDFSNEEEKDAELFANGRDFEGGLGKPHEGDELSSEGFLAVNLRNLCQLLSHLVLLRNFACFLPFLVSPMMASHELQLTRTVANHEAISSTMNFLIMLSNIENWPRQHFSWVKPAHRSRRLCIAFCVTNWPSLQKHEPAIQKSKLNCPHLIFFASIVPVDLDCRLELLLWFQASSLHCCPFKPPPRSSPRSRPSQRPGYPVWKAILQRRGLPVGWYRSSAHFYKWHTWRNIDWQGRERY